MNTDQLKSIKQMGIANLTIASIIVGLMLVKFAGNLCVTAFQFMYENYLFFIHSKPLIFLSFLLFMITCSVTLVVLSRIAYVRFKKYRIRRIIACATYR